MTSVVLPVLLTIISLIGSALIAVNIKYAVDKSDAIQSLKGLGKGALLLFYKLWVGFSFLYAMYQLGGILLDDGVVDRAILLKVTILILCIMGYIVSIFGLVALWFVKRIMDVQSRHLKITEETLSYIPISEKN